MPREVIESSPDYYELPEKALLKDGAGKILKFIQTGISIAILYGCTSAELNFGPGDDFSILHPSSLGFHFKQISRPAMFSYGLLSLLHYLECPQSLDLKANMVPKILANLTWLSNSIFRAKLFTSSQSKLPIIYSITNSGIVLDSINLSAAISRKLIMDVHKGQNLDALNKIAGKIHVPNANDLYEPWEMIKVPYTINIHALQVHRDAKSDVWQRLTCLAARYRRVLNQEPKGADVAKK